MQLATNQGSAFANLPAPALGMYVANYLIDATGTRIQGATNGVNTGLDILLENQEHPEASFALLEQLGTILQVNVPDMLNRSTDRQKTLDAYISTLTQVADRSISQVTALKQQQKTLLAVQHDKRGIVASIQHDLNSALQKQDYTTASEKQSAIVDAKAEQSKAEAEVNQIGSTINLYNNLNAIAAKRLKAIQANREVLIAGLQVVDLPGVNDLGVLKKQNGGGSTNGGSIFGSTGN